MPAVAGSHRWRLEEKPDPTRQPVATAFALAVILAGLFLYSSAPKGPEPQPVAVTAPQLISKDNPLQPLDYAPARLRTVHGIELADDAATAFEALHAAAAADGVMITAVSGYRSFAHQQQLHAQYTAQYGTQEAARISAPPGHSEHQSGLAVDIGTPERTCALQACFSGTPAGAWAAENAWRYGFIVRYPEGAEKLTGYAYEPWHLRWIGTAAAADMQERRISTLEEYVQLLEQSSSSRGES